MVNSVLYSAENELFASCLYPHEVTCKENSFFHCSEFPSVLSNLLLPKEMHKCIWYVASFLVQMFQVFKLCLCSRYCDCFANGEFCHNCNCNNCANNLEHEEDRSRAIKSCLERNPLAFHPKIGRSFRHGNTSVEQGCSKEHRVTCPSRPTQKV